MHQFEPYHAGEIEVQEHAGVRRQADQLSDMILPFIPPAAGNFVSAQRLSVIGSVDANGRVWASALIGDPGFLSLPDENTLLIASQPTDDVIWENLRTHQQVGVVILDPASRRRLRVNGNGKVSPRGISVYAEQAFTNCTKYIQRRAPLAAVAAAAKRRTKQSVSLDGEEQKWIHQSDTFFIATTHPEAGTDASHRGGMPGFVTIVDARTLQWPDYTGNNMFQSLGNLTVNPKAGLLFVDFEHGRTLQLTGTAEVIWDKDQYLQFPGAKRLLKFHVDEVISTEGAFAQRWQLLEYSPVNPKLDAE